MGLPTAEEVQDVFTQDTAGRITHEGAQPVPTSTGLLDPETGTVSAAPVSYSQADFDKNLPAWVKLVASGKKSLQDVIATIESKAPLTDAQKQRLHAAISGAAAQDATPKAGAAPALRAPDGDAPDVTPEAVAQRMRAARNLDALYEAASLIDAAPAEHYERLSHVFNTRQTELEGQA